MKQPWQEELADKVAELRPSDPVAPSQDRYQILTEELQQAQRQLAGLELLADLENIPAGEFGRKNLLEVRYPPAKNRDVPRGPKLSTLVDGQRAVVTALEQFLADWNTADEAFHASFDAAKPSVVPTVTPEPVEVDA